MNPTIAQQLETIEKLQELSNSVAIKPEHKEIFNIFSDYYKQCYETDPDEEEPSSYVVFDKLKTFIQSKSKGTVQKARNSSQNSISQVPPEMISPSLSQIDQVAANTQDSAQKNIVKELQKLNSSKGKGRQTLVPEGGLQISSTQWTSTTGEPPSVVNTELNYQSYLPTRNEEEINIDSFINVAMFNNSQDDVENNNNEAQSASKSQAPPAINSTDGNSPPPQQEGESQVGGTAGSSKEMVIHPAFSGPMATDPNPGLERILEVQEEHRAAKRLKRIRSRTSASEAASNSSSVNIGLPEEAVSRLSGYKSIAFEESDINTARVNCRFIIENLHCMLGEAHMTMDGATRIKKLRTKEIYAMLKTNDVLGVNDNDILLKSSLIDFQLLKTLLATPISSTELLAVILRPSAEITQSSYAQFKDVLSEVTTLAQSVDFFRLSETMFSNVETTSNRAFELAYEHISSVLGNSSFLISGCTVANNNYVPGGPGIRRLVDYFSHCIHGLFMLWRTKVPENQRKKMTSFAAEADSRGNLRSLYCLSNFLLMGPRAVFTANSSDVHKQTRWQSLARLDLTCTIIREQMRRDDDTTRWGPFGNLRYAFIQLASEFLRDSIDWKFMLESWMHFLSPYNLIYSISLDVELMINDILDS